METFQTHIFSQFSPILISLSSNHPLSFLLKWFYFHYFDLISVPVSLLCVTDSSNKLESEFIAFTIWYDDLLF